MRLPLAGLSLSLDAPHPWPPLLPLQLYVGQSVLAEGGAASWRSWAADPADLAAKFSRCRAARDPELRSALAHTALTYLLFGWAGLLPLAILDCSLLAP